MSRLYIHRVDPHYSHDFADLYFEGAKFCLTENAGKPISPLEMIEKFGTRREAEQAAHPSDTRPERGGTDGN